MRCLPISLALLLSCHGSAWATEKQDLRALRTAATRYLESQATIAFPDARPEVSVGAIDPRLNLTACSNLTLSLPAGSQLWGSGNLQAQCSAPASWGLYLTYKITLRGPALLAKRPYIAGERPLPADFARGEVEYTGDPGRYPRSAAELGNATLTRPLAKNQAVTVDILRVPAIIKAGQRVRILVDGQGFQISQEGIAQGQAGVGDTLRLKTPSGRMVQGIVHPDGTVHIRP